MQQSIFASVFLFVILVIAIVMVFELLARRKTKGVPFLTSPIVSAKNKNTNQYVEAIFYNGYNQDDVLDWIAEKTRYRVSSILDALLLGDSIAEKNVYFVRVMIDRAAVEPYKNGISSNEAYRLFTVPEAQFDNEFELLHWHILETVA